LLAVGGSRAAVVDKQGNGYVAATWTHRVYKIAPDGTATVFVSENAGLAFPNGLALDNAGNLYVCDGSKSQVSKVDPQGNITVVAGTGGLGFSGDKGPATAAELNFPSGIAVDSAGNLYIGDSLNNRVRRVDTSGVIDTVAGNGTGGLAGDNGAATSAELFFPSALAVDGAGNLFIADESNNVVRKVDASGTITTVPGSEGPGPRGVAVDNLGNLYVAYSGENVVSQISASGTVSTVAGGGTGPSIGDGGQATSAVLDLPAGLAFDAASNLYIADEFNSRIRKVDGSGTISTFAGNGKLGASGDGGPATNAELDDARFVLAGSSNDVLVADGENNQVRVVASGLISTVVGDGRPFIGFSGDGGPATAAEMTFPVGLAKDANGNLFIADSSNNRVRKVDSSGNITTIAGTGTAGFSGDNGPAINAQLAGPFGVALDSQGNLYISDFANNRIRRVDGSGTITTVAGNGTGGFAGDGGSAILAELNVPQGIAVDTAGNLYIADLFNSRIRKVDGTGIITTVAGGGTVGFAGDGGPATSASLNEPTGVAVDRSGNLYIADTVNTRVRKVDSQGIITTLAGSSVAGFAGDNGPATNAELNFPEGVAVDVAGNVYIADAGNNRIREVLSGIDFSATSLNFGQVGVGRSASLQFHITNPGNAPLNITNLSFSGGNAGDFSQSGNCIGMIPAGGQCAAAVAFTPSNSGGEGANLVISDDALSSSQVVILSGIGVPPLGLSSSALNFGGVGQGVSSSLTLQISNTGTVPVTISGITLAGANAGDFSQTSNCIGNLPAGAQCTATVSFTPGGTMAETASLVLSGSNPFSPQVVSLSGNGIAPFTMAPATGSLMIPAPGGSTSTMVTIAPVSGFTGAVSLACSVAFQGPGTAVDLPSCSLNPAQLNLTASTNTTLTIGTTAPSLSRLSPTGTGGFSWQAASTLALLGLVIVGVARTRNHRWIPGLVLLSVVLALAGAGCGGGGSVMKHSDPGTTAGTYAVTVTATHGNATASTVVTVTVQ
jgi:sugar lactone lactonase YvrE